MKFRFALPLWDKYFSRMERIVLLLLVLVGFMLRVINAVCTPLWRDEIYIFFVARNNSLWSLINQQHWDTAHPPLFSIFLHFWQKISIEPFWLRLPSLLAALAILYLIPILAVKISKKFRLFPFMLLFLYAFSLTQISINMVVRPYPFVSLVSIVSVILLIDAFEKSRLRMKNSLAIIVINVLGLCVDYSYIWILASFFVTLGVAYYMNAEKRKDILMLLKAFVWTLIFLIPLFIHLFLNLSQSLHLEEFASIKFNPDPITNTLNGRTLTLDLDAKRHWVTVRREKDILISKKTSWIPPQEKETQYIGFNIPPLSGLIVNDLSYCDSKRDESCTDYHDYKNILMSTGMKSIISLKIGNHILFFNLHPTDWKSHIVPLPKTQGIMHESVRTAFIALGQYPSAQVVFPISKVPDLRFANEAQFSSEITFLNRNLNYSVRISKAVPAGFNEPLLTSVTFFDKFGEDILFFAGLPSYENSIYQLISVLLLAIAFIVLITLLRKERKFAYLLTLAMFVVPSILSYVLSVVFSPVFVARNLYITTIAYNIAFGLLLSHLLKGEFDSHTKNKMAGVLLFMFFLYSFFDRFPYLHYTDPPYDINRMVRRITNKAADYPTVIILDNANYYTPYVLYNLMLVKADKIVTLKTLDEFKKASVANTNNKLTKPAYRYYFIRFGMAATQEVGAFTEIAKLLKCAPTRTDMKFAYFALCK